MKKALGIEFFKLKGSKILWIVILVPIFVVIQGGINFIRYHDLFTSKGQNIWGKIYEQSSIFYVMMMLPILIAIVMALSAKVENNNDGWKYFLTLPIKRSKVYFAKLITTCTMILINIFCFSTSIFIVGKFLGAEKVVPYSLIFGKPILMYIAALPIMAILYLISMRFSNIGVPLGIGIGFAMPSVIAANTKIWFIYPWTYPIMAGIGDKFDKVSNGIIMYPACIIFFIIIISIGCTRFVQKDI